MSATFSEHWYRVAHLHPRLRSHIKLDRHCYRSEIWHVLKDPLSGRQHRINSLAFAVVARFAGDLSLQQIWDLVVSEQGDAAPTQSEVLALLAQLHEAELIQTEAAPDVAELFEHSDRWQARHRRQRLNPFSMRVPLLDPTSILTALVPLGRVLLQPWVAWAWFFWVALTVVRALPEGSALMAYGNQHLQTPRMLLVLWVVYPLIKVVHEFAHGLAVRVWGGEVREMGVSLLLLMPVPYVDASSAAGFRHHSRRVVVSLMGILAETSLAACAVWVWMGVSDGLVRELAFAVILIGGVSTVIFNGNPLLRFDAYYALSDAIESPGLGARSNAYWGYLMRRYVLGVSQAVPPSMLVGERKWFVGYGLASNVYRLFTAVLIVVWLISWQVFLGAAAASYLLATMVIYPAWKLLRYARRSPELHAGRVRALTLAVLALIAPLWILFAMPVPDSTLVQGVVWAPEKIQIRNDDDGFVEQVAVYHGQKVVPGQVLLQLSNPVLSADFKRAQARVNGLEVAYQQVLFNEPAKANLVEQELRRAQAERDRMQNRMAALSVRSQVSGRVVLVQHVQDLPGVFLTRGTLVAYVLGSQQANVRVVVPETDIARLQKQTGSIEVRLADAPTESAQAQFGSQTPAALHVLPNPALGDKGGGTIVTDPSDPDGLRTMEPHYALDLVLPQHEMSRLGGRVWARFDHGRAPFVQQCLYRIRQIFTGRQNVSQPL
jgi:putative peptide zinc metalloprotease protein